MRWQGVELPHIPRLCSPRRCHHDPHCCTQTLPGSAASAALTRLRARRCLPAPEFDGKAEFLCSPSTYPPPPPPLFELI